VLFWVKAVYLHENRSVMCTILAVFYSCSYTFRQKNKIKTSSSIVDSVLTCYVEEGTVVHAPTPVNTICKTSSNAHTVIYS
jgi:hypothetical protein